MEDLNKIMEEMEWPDGFHIPIANKENIKLEVEVQRLTIAKSTKSVNRATNASKCTDLKKYFKSLCAEEEQNQKILLVQNDQLDTEKSICKSTKTEKEKLHSCVKQADNEYKKVQDRNEYQCKMLRNLLQKVEKLKVSLEWDEGAIEECQNELLKEEIDNEIIKEFSLMDKKKFDELELKRQRLQSEEIASKQLITRINTEVKEMDLILTRNIQIYRQMHDERSVFVQRWKETVQYLHERDQQIMTLRKEIISTEDLNTLEGKSLKEIIQTHEKLKSDNCLAKEEINKTLGKRSQLDEKLHYINTLRQDRKSEKLNMKAELRNIAVEINKNRINYKNLEQKFERKNAELKAVMARVRDLTMGESQLHIVFEKQSNYIKTLEEMVQKEEDIGKDWQMKRSRLLIYETDLQNRMNARKQVAQGIEFSILQLKASIRKVKSIKKTTIKTLHFNKILIYRLISQVYKFGQAINKNKKKQKADQERRERINKSFREKEQVLKNINDLVRIKVTELQTIFTKLLKSYGTEKIIFDEEKEREHINRIDIGNLKKEKLHTEQKLHELKVLTNIEMVKLKHVQQITKRQNTLTFEAKRQQVELETAMRERITEIDANKQIFLLAKHTLEGEISELKTCIRSTQLKTNVLKDRYELLLKSLGKTEDGEIASPEYFWLKTLQEKSILEKEGDKLDSQIKQAEAEIIALENSLKVVRDANERYKRSMTGCQDNDEIIAKILSLQEELSKQSDILIEGRNDLAAVTQKLQVLHAKLNDIVNKIKETLEDFEKKGKQLSGIEFDAKNRSIKIDRAQKQLRKLIMTENVDEILEKDFVTYKLKEYNLRTFQLLSKAGADHVDIGPNINRYLLECDLMPVTCVCPILRSESISTSSSEWNSSRSFGIAD